MKKVIAMVTGSSLFLPIPGLILIFICLLSLGCSNDDDQARRCDFETIMSAEQYRSAAFDQLTIHDLEIEDDCLQIKFSSGGCAGETWEIKLIDSEDVFESNPPQRNLRLSLNNKELCEALITKEVSFDISALQVEENKVRLNIINSDESVLYEY